MYYFIKKNNDDFYNITPKYFDMICGESATNENIFMYNTFFFEYYNYLRNKELNEEVLDKGLEYIYDKYNSVTSLLIEYIDNKIIEKRDGLIKQAQSELDSKLIESLKRANELFNYNQTIKNLNKF